MSAIGLLARSVVRDIRVNRRRSAAMFLGTLLAVSVLTAFAAADGVIDREIRTSFAETRPAAIILGADAGIPADVEESLSALPGVVGVETRGELRFQVRDRDGVLIPLRVTVVQDLRAPTVARFAFFPTVGGARSQGLAIERGSAELLPETGPLAVVGLDGEWAVPQAGRVHDEGRAPGFMENWVDGYVDRATAAEIGWVAPSDRLLLALDDSVESAVVATEARARLTEADLGVELAIVNDVASHPHENQMQAIVRMISRFALLIAAAGLVTAAQTTYALAATQVRTIGLLGVVGVGRVAVALRQSAVAVGPILAGATVGVALGGLGGAVVASIGLGALNITADSVLPSGLGFLGPSLLYVGLVIVVVAMLATFVSSSWPARLLNAHPKMGRPGRRRSTASTAALFSGALTEMSRRRLPLIASTVAIAIAATTFISAVNLRVAWANTVNREVSRIGADVSVSMEPTPVETVEAALTGVRGLTRVEMWGAIALGESPNPHGTAGSDGRLVAVPADTALTDVEIVQGSWLSDEQGPTVVVDERMAQLFDIGVGDSLGSSIAGLPIRIPIVGVARPSVAGEVPEAFIARDELAAVLGLATLGNFANEIHMLVDDNADANAVAAAVADNLSDDQIGFHRVSSAGDRRAILDGHLLPLIAILITIALSSGALVIVGLRTGKELDLHQRRRQIALLRVIGFSDRRLGGRAAIEALVVIAAATVLALPLAAVTSTSLGATVGNILVGFPIEVPVTFTGVGWWVVIGGLAGLVVTLSALESVLKRPLAQEIQHR